MIIEIKPDSDKAQAEAVDQRAAYAQGLINWYARNKDELFNKYPKIRECEHDDKLAVDTKTETYHFCPDSSEAVLDDAAAVEREASAEAAARELADRCPRSSIGSGLAMRSRGTSLFAGQPRVAHRTLARARDVRRRERPRRHRDRARVER